MTELEPQSGWQNSSKILIKSGFFAIADQFKSLTARLPGSIRVAALVIIIALIAELFFSVTPKSQAEMVYGGPISASAATSFALEGSATAVSSIFTSDSAAPEVPQPLNQLLVSASLTGSVGAGSTRFFNQTVSQAGDESGHYLVGPGDTLLSVAAAQRVDVKSFAKLNGLKEGDILIVGDELLLPSQITTPSSKQLKRVGYLPAGFYGPLSGSSGKIDAPHGPHHGRFDAYDYPAKQGTPIRAAANGIVVEALYGYSGGYGNHILIDHASVGFSTMYAHIMEGGIIVTPGEQVKRGQVIGYVGSTGNSTGPHLHFEVRDSAH